MVYQLDPTANQSSYVDPFIEAEGVKRFDMRVKEGESVLFRILPAFPPDGLQESPDGTVTAADPNAWVPFRDPVSGGHFCWGRMIHLIQGVGYGAWRDRESFILPKTFEHRTGSSTCAYTALYYKAKNSADWKYLTEDQVDGQGKRVSAVLPYPKQQLLTVVYEPGDPGKRGVYIAMLPKSASNAMFDDNGVCNALNVQWDASMDPMYKWACGDITHPETGPVFMLTRKKGTDGRTLYHVTPAPAQDGTGVQRWPISAEQLAKRPVLANDTMFKAKDNQEIVKILAGRLTGTSPFGDKEYGLLRETFGDSYELPEPTTAAAQPAFSGFSAPAPMPGPGAPAAGMPGPVAQTGFNQPPPAAPIPVPTPAPAATPVPAPTPVAMPEQPAAPIAGQPLAATPTPVPQAPTPPVAPAPETHGAVPAMPQPPEAGQTQQPAAPVPGQPVDFDRDSFMKEISGK